MYTLYNMIAKKIYSKNYSYVSKSKSKSYEDFILLLAKDVMEQNVFVLGQEKRCSSPYCIAKCIRDYDPKLGEYLINKLNSIFDKKINSSGTIDDVCQRYFNYNYRYVFNQFKALGNYLRSMKDKAIAPMDGNMYEDAKMIYRILFSNLTIQEKIQKIVEYPNDLSGICDGINEYLKKNFVEELNEYLTIKQNDFEESPIILDGQDFGFLVYSSTEPEKFIKKDIFEHPYSTTFVNQVNMQCDQIQNIKIIMGGEIEADNLISASAYDGYTYYNPKTKELSISNPFDYLSIDRFIEMSCADTTKKVSTLNFKGNSKMKPVGVVCYDFVKEEEYKFAKKHGLKIVLIRTKNYPNAKVPTMPPISDLEKVDINKIINSKKR